MLWGELSQNKTKNKKKTYLQEKKVKVQSSKRNKRKNFLNQKIIINGFTFYLQNFFLRQSSREGFFFPSYRNICICIKEDEGGIKGYVTTYAIQLAKKRKRERSKKEKEESNVREENAKWRSFWERISIMLLAAKLKEYIVCGRNSLVNLLFFLWNEIFPFFVTRHHC